MDSNMSDNEKFLTEQEIDFIKSNYSNLGGKYIAVYLNKPLNLVYQKARLLHLKYNKYDFTSELINSKPETMYFWGFFFADGHVDDDYGFNLHINIDDAKDVELTLDSVANWNKYYYTPKSGQIAKKTSVKFRLARKDFYQNYLHKWQLKQKSLFLSDEFFKFISQTEEGKRMFIRGFIDGDGYIGNSRIYITSTIDFLWGSILKILPNNIFWSIDKTVKKNGYKTSTLRFNVHNSYLLMKFAYDPSSYCDIGLTRKKNKAWNLIKKYEYSNQKIINMD